MGLLFLHDASQNENPTHFKELDGGGLFESHLVVSSRRRRLGWFLHRYRTETVYPKQES